MWKNDCISFQSIVLTFSWHDWGIIKTSVGELVTRPKFKPDTAEYKADFYHWAVELDKKKSNVLSSGTYLWIVNQFNF
jgi:hypothetical protein